MREALEVLIDTDAARHRTPADIADIKKLLTRLRSAAAKGTTPFLLANWDLHERIALISPNQTASALYLSMTRFVREHAVAATHDDAPETASEWLQIRIETHQELVDAIVRGRRRGREGGRGQARRAAAQRVAAYSARTNCSKVVGERPRSQVSTLGLPTKSCRL